MKQGDKFIKNKTVNGKILIATVTKDLPEYEHLAKVRISILGGGELEETFRHVDILKTKWTDMKNGVQLKCIK